jgi:hypothetical protein
MKDVLRQASLELSSAADRDIALRLERERRPVRLDATRLRRRGDREGWAGREADYSIAVKLQ